MKKIEVSEFTLETLIESLEGVIHACEKVDYSLSKEDRMKTENTEKTAPYIVGYTRGAISTVIENLKNLKMQAN